MSVASADKIVQKISECLEKEAEIAAYRKKLEKKLLELVPVKKEGGSITTNVLDYKVKTNVNVVRSVDTLDVEKILPKLSDVGKACFVTKYTVSMKHLNSLEHLDAREYEKVKKIIKTKVSQPSVSVTKEG
jgi:hypothetical protein